MGKLLVNVFVTLTLVLFVTGCSNKTPDQSTCKGAYELYAQAQLKGDYLQIYSMINGNVTAIKELPITLENITELNYLIPKLPIAMQGHFKKRLKDESLFEARSPGELFSLIVKPKEPMALQANATQSFKSRYKTCSSQGQGSGEYIAESLDGQQTTFVRRGDGLLYLVPSRQVIRALNDAYVRSQNTLKEVRTAVQASSEGPTP